MENTLSQIYTPVPFSSDIPNQRFSSFDDQLATSRQRSNKLLSIVIPAYNEEKTISIVLERINNVCLIGNIEKEVIVVDDCSKDGTYRAINQYCLNNPKITIKYFRHKENLGKGAALHTGIAQSSGEYLLVQDADLEYDPVDYNKLLEPIVGGLADVVYGSRFLGGGTHRVLNFWHSIGNRWITLISNMFSNLNLTDMETGYKVFRTDIIQQLYLREERFGFEPEVTIKISHLPNVRIYEVGISYCARTYGEGKKIGWRDGIRALYCIMKYGLFCDRVIVDNKSVDILIR